MKSEELIELLKQQAKEIADAGHNGWGNTMLFAADRLRSQAGAVPEWRPMSGAPKDGRLLRLLVEFDENPTEEVPGLDAAVTIGCNNLDNDGEDECLFAGWCWEHDHFTEGKGKVVGWLPILAAPPSPAVDEQVRAFGKGDKVVKTGRYGGVPAVFIAHAKWPGDIGSDASRERQPNDALTPDEIVLTFPTDEQAAFVADALCNEVKA